MKAELVTQSALTKYNCVIWWRQNHRSLRTLILFHWNTTFLVPFLLVSKLSLHIWITSSSVQLCKATKAFSSLVSERRPSGHVYFIDCWRMWLFTSIPTQWNMSQKSLQRQASFSAISFIVLSGNDFLSPSQCIPWFGSQDNLFKWLITKIIKGTQQMLPLNAHLPGFTSPTGPDSDETT